MYWQDGGQLVPPQDAEIISVINQLDYAEIKFEAKENLNEKFSEVSEKIVEKAFLTKDNFSWTKNKTKRNFYTA